MKVNAVVLYDICEAETYMHRVGRCGRFGTRGITVTFIADDEDQKVFDDIQKRFLIKAENLPDKIDPNTYRKIILI